MRREQFSLAVSNVAWVEDGGEPRMPSVTVDFGGEEAALRERLSDPDGDLLDARETDVTFRLHGSLEADDADGVVAVTNRITGDYVLEINVDAADVLAFMEAARRYGERTDETARYRARVAVDGEELITYEKRTLLVYGPDGELLRGYSLIPSGVEI